jgi:hypothetical protein
MPPGIEQRALTSGAPQPSDQQGVSATHRMHQQVPGGEVASSTPSGSPQGIPGAGPEIPGLIPESPGPIPGTPGPISGSPGPVPESPEPVPGSPGLVPGSSEPVPGTLGLRDHKFVAQSIVTTDASHPLRWTTINIGKHIQSANTSSFNPWLVATGSR